MGKAPRGEWLRAMIFRWLIAIGIVLAIGAALATYHVTFNSTDSMPMGFYTVDPRAVVKSGSIVVVCPPSDVAKLGLSRHYIRLGRCDSGAAYLLKIVVATAGDVVVASDAGISVNGHLLPSSKTMVRDTAGRPLPHIDHGTYGLKAGQIWLWTPNPRSWDSRYYGPLASSDVAGIATLVLPVWEWPYGAAALRRAVTN